MTGFTRQIEEEYNRRRGQADAWSRLPERLHELAELLGQELKHLIEPLVLSPLPEGIAAGNPLDALVSQHVNESLLSRGWWGGFALRTVKGTVRFGRTRLDPNVRLRLAATRGGDWYLSPKTESMLLPHGTSVHFRHDGQRLRVGFDLPQEDGPLTVSDALGEASIDFYIKPGTDVERVFVDRLLARPWSAMRVTGLVGRTARPILPVAADSTMPLAQITPPRGLLRNLVRLPITLYDGLERSEFQGERLFWFSLPWPEPFDADAGALFARTQINVVIFSDRIPGCLNAGMDPSRIPRCTQISHQHAACITRVYDPGSGREYHDRREAAAVSAYTYRVRPVLDDREFIAELLFDDAQRQNTSIEYEYVPLHGAPDDLRVGASIGAEYSTTVTAGELLATWQCDTTDGDGPSLWKAFASGLAHRGRCVTRRETAALVKSLDYFHITKSLDVERIRFDHYIGRVAGHSGIVPYTLISLCLSPVRQLSPQDCIDAAYLIETRLNQGAGLNDCFKVKVFDGTS